MLDDEGIKLPMTAFQQGFVSMGPAVDAFETALFSGMMQHNNNPVLTWQAGNVRVETDAAGNRKPTKSRSNDKIDGLVSIIMACGAAAKRTDKGLSTDSWVEALVATGRHKAAA
jgi:phage terminase large subunit-like protein